MDPKSKTVKFHIVYGNSIIGAKTHTLLVSSQSNIKASFRQVAKSFVNVNDTDNVILYLGDTIVLFQYDLLDEKVEYNLAIIPEKKMDKEEEEKNLTNQQNVTYFAKLKKAFEENEVSNDLIDKFFSHYDKKVVFLRSIQNKADSTNFKEILGKIFEENLEEISTISQIVLEFNQSFSNVHDDLFLYAMKQLKYCIIYDSRFPIHSIPESNLIPKRARINEEESSMIDTEIHFPRYLPDPNNYLKETTATPIMIKCIRELLDSVLRVHNYKIVDVHASDKCKFTIGVKPPFNGQDKLMGKTAAVIVPMFIEEKDLASHVCVGIEFKTPTKMSNNDTQKQFLLEFIGALSSRSRSNKNLPILFVCTDFHNFKFLWMPEQEKKIIHCFETRDVCNSIKLIKEFIVYHHSIANNNPQMNRQVTLSSEPNCVTELCSTPSSDELSENDFKAAKIEEVLNKYLQDKTLESKRLHDSITKLVYKIEIDNKFYALKMCSKDKSEKIYDFISNEENIYRYLSNLRKEIGDCIPELYYSGMIKKKYYAIVTRFIEGRRPSWHDHTDIMLCYKALGKINNVGVQHLDPRTANFIIVEKKLTDGRGQRFSYQSRAIILDFGFSRITFFKEEEYLQKDR